MPIFEVMSPDGRKYRVTAPNGATQEDAIAYVQGGSVAPMALPEQAKPQQSMSPIGQALSGGLPMFGGGYAADMGMGMKQVLDAGAQVLARATGMGVKDTEAANQRTRDLYEQNFAPESRPGAALLRGVGQSLAVAPVTPALAAGGLVRSVAQGAGMGGSMGALTPVYGAGDDADFWKQKRQQVIEGAAGGGIAGGASSVVGRVLAPKVNPQAQMLLDQDVTPTPGQILGGAWKTGEEKIRSVPLLGEAITAGQRRAIEEYNRSLYRKALDPIGLGKEAKALPVGNDGIRAVGDRLSAAYDGALARSVPSPVDLPFKSALTKLESMVPRAMRKDFADIIDSQVRARVTQGQTLTPTVAKEVESELGRLAVGYRGSATESERQLGRALQQAQQEVRALVARHNPVTAPELRKIDQGWSVLTQLENAGSMLGAKEGIFTPAQFLNAVKKSDKSIRDRAFARGTARNQEIAQAADSVLSQRYPDSGTAGRAMLGGALGGGLGYLNPAIPAAAGLGALAYTPIGQRATAAMMTQRPQSAKELGELLKRLSPYLGGPGAAGLLSLSP
ncbi:MAG: hypothetical protein MUC51_07175 [Anaerolineae bacterium]|jgi:hypothetical protein|nr:hypothetical protein [Anaerolineae bacterium]